MATIPIGVRLDEELVRRIDAIASETGVSRTDVIDRCIRFGLRKEEDFVDVGPVMMELANVILSDPVRKPLEMLLGRANQKQLERFRHMRQKRRAERVKQGRSVPKGGPALE